MAACATTAPAQMAIDRTVLPIPEPQYPHSTVLDARNATPPPRFEIKAPAGAPNVLMVLIDDMGFGQSSAFGGPINMPTVDRLATNGLRFNEFHTTALCSPTRSALLTKRNHHMNNTGSIMETATAFPGNTGQRPESVAPLAMMLRYNGYSTAAFGKNHETAAWEVSPSGPTDRWPTRSGFDKFYGFMGGETNQWAPTVYDGMTKVEVPRDPNYHFMTDMTNQAIKWMRSVKSLTPDEPFFHVIDIAPTVLEAAGLPEPKAVNGIPQTPIEGVSMLYSFNDAQARGRHLTQYFEIFGNRAIYHDGWLAGTIHKAPWEEKPRATLENDTWELYDTRADFSLANDQAGKNPDKLKEMQDLFMKEAEKYNVLPIDDRGIERTNPALAGRFGGWSLYLKNGRPTYTYNFLGLKRFTIAAKNPVPAGKATIRYEFTYDGGGLGKGGLGTISVNGKKAAEGRIERTQRMVFSADEGADVGEDGETPVIEDYGIRAPYKFTGKINKVTIDLKEMKTAEKAEENKLRAEAAHRKALSD
jgi:hypothetical protein